ncbi:MULTISPECIES: hypothetical protein [unclassified Endozoicomonas]|uniref:hypothetical protein n=1 Tax=unclassified Endozoicomonas TaxID=2644528 RepID=UPI0021474FE7|nr:MULTISPECIES: hypothetical protein [unclassified Endozoicomonas]
MRPNPFRNGFSGHFCLNDDKHRNSMIRNHTKPPAPGPVDQTRRSWQSGTPEGIID